jgi:hypothetical protein
VVATRPDNPAGRNLALNPEVQLALGHPALAAGLAGVERARRPAADAEGAWLA